MMTIYRCHHHDHHHPPPPHGNGIMPHFTVVLCLPSRSARARGGEPWLARPDCGWRHMAGHLDHLRSSSGAPFKLWMFGWV